MSANVYQMVTDRIIAELEKGNSVPWLKPWTGVNSGAYNRISKKPYSLLNQLLLGKAGEWMSFKQIQDLGGKVRKGEKASFVVFWKMVEIEEQNADGQLVKKTIPYLRYSNVFHVDQTEGIEPLPVGTLKDIEPIAEAEKVKNDYQKREGVRIEEVIGDDAFYSPLRDYIQIPAKSQFTDVAEYYGTLFHEMTHSTMHPNRCNRAEDRKGKLVAFGSDEYSKEELIAAIGSACLLNTLGIETPHSFKNSVGYIQGWIEVLKNDNKFIVSATSKAEKAVNYILNQA